VNSVTSLFIRIVTDITFIVHQSQSIALTVIKNIVKFIVHKEEIDIFETFGECLTLAQT
jgi:hypothetical protein